MNVKEINDTGHGIWSFVVTALVMLLSSLAAWLAWRAWRNMKLVHERRGLIWFLQYRWSWQKSIAVLSGLVSLNDGTVLQSGLRKKPP